MPSRLLGHVIVVGLCLAVTYAGRPGTSGTARTDGTTEGLTLGSSPFVQSEGTLPGVLGQTSPPAGDSGASRSQVVDYTVEPGDTVSSLADRFDVSDNTILWANYLAPGQALAPGQHLTILPVSGVLYTVQAGDTVADIASRFQSDVQSIAEYNGLAGDLPVAPGAELVIPGGRAGENRLALSSPARTDPSVSTADIAPSLAQTLHVHQTVSSVAPPVGSAASPIAATEHVAAVQPLTPITYRVVAGDTLASIAQRFGVAPESIAAASGLQSNPDNLVVNQKLVIPPVPGVVYTVQEGDTLNGIALRYSADSNVIARANGLGDPQALQAGQTIVIPGGKVPEVVPTAAPAPPTPQATYTVQAGDSLSSIAASFGVEVRSIVGANHLIEPYVLQPGQQIVVPGAGSAPRRRDVNPSPEPAAAAQPNTNYIVQAGDTLVRIAAAYAVDPQSIADANGLADPSALRAGQQIVIPGATHSVVHSNLTATPTAAPAPPPPPTPTPRPVVARPTPVPTPAPQPRREPSTDSGWKIVALASKYLGTPYVWGGTTPSGFDCSGLVWYVYRRAGISIPRDMWGQLQSGTRVSRSALQPGDIVFFVNTYKPGLSHDGIYIGGGRLINAVNYGVGVAVVSLADPYWSGRYYGATRPW